MHQEPRGQQENLDLRSGEIKKKIHLDPEMFGVTCWKKAVLHLALTLAFSRVWRVPKVLLVRTVS